MGPGTFGYNPNINRPAVFTIVQTDQKPFIDPNKGIEQFFDENGPGPTDVDRKNWESVTNSKTDIGRGGFPDIENKVKKKQDEQSSIKGMVSKIFQDFFSSLKSTLFTIIIIALGVSFAFFYLKTIALRGKI